jgi:hypothetical protein
VSCSHVQRSSRGTTGADIKGAAWNAPLVTYYEQAGVVKIDRKQVVIAGRTYDIQLMERPID